MDRVTDPELAEYEATAKRFQEVWGMSLSSAEEAATIALGGEGDSQALGPPRAVPAHVNGSASGKPIA